MSCPQIGRYRLTIKSSIKSPGARLTARHRVKGDISLTDMIIMTVRAYNSVLLPSVRIQGYAAIVRDWIRLDELPERRELNRRVSGCATTACVDQNYDGWEYFGVDEGHFTPLVIFDNEERRLIQPRAREARGRLLGLCNFIFRDVFG